ncbi:hypothetical protein F2Q69_00021478 [Brassica cretica]|uniref:Uncharacterized protein n=1 Tax=Brassica cretica TaxID=69181 RepID=A0A8S9QDY5_BRACR|nr:hypothetical protein F2Q69_00021478 [Brassica cretica]
MWGDNSSIDSGASFFGWSMMVTSARFSCFVPSFLHQSALVLCCYALVLGDQVSYAVMLGSGFLSVVEFGWCLFTGLQLGSPWCGFWLCSLYMGPPCDDLCSKSFLEKEKHYLRWLAHPVMFAKKIGSKLLDVQTFVTIRIIGAVPVSNMNFYKLLHSKTHVVLYPGLYVKLCAER